MDFSQLHDMFFESYNARFPKMVRIWSQLRRTEELTQLKEFKFETHSLKGEAGALGFDELFSIVKNIDDITHNILLDGFNAESIKDVDSQLNLLIAAGKEDNNPLLKHPNKKSSEDFDEAIRPKLIESPLDVSIALVDADKATAFPLVELLSSFGFSTTYFDSIPALEFALQSEHFDLLLLDVVMPDNRHEEVFAFAKRCSQNNIKVISTSSRDDLNIRLHAVRHGVDDYALKPININTLVGKIRRCFKLDSVRPFNIVLLDDQPFIGNYFKQMAEKQGFELTAFSDANEFIRNLDISIPDIFLLDINMPEVTGLEIAQILRYESRFEYVPIVFLSGDTTLETKLKALSAGGEDVIHKSDAPADIFQQIESRVLRGQYIRSIAVKDGLTGLLNHAQLMEAMSNCQRLAKRVHSTFAVAILDLDNFKKVNDTYGHSTGDVVLVGVAQIIRQYVRQTDIAGRYGGEEFVLVFQNIKTEKAIIEKLDQIRKVFSSIKFETDGAVIQASFSCGVTFSNESFSIGTLMKQADIALYKAKAQGKNCIVQFKD